MKLFITADLHLGHEKVMIMNADRPFATIKEHDEAIIKNWNDVVLSKDDKVIVAGDVSFHNKERTEKLIKRLRGY